MTLSRRRALTLLGAGAASLAAACTRTVYVIQNPDGTFTEVDGPDTDPSDNAVVDDGLIIQLLSSNAYVIEGQPVHLMVVVEAPADAVVEHRAPMNIGLVLDRSGSMNGGKLEGAKDAAAHVLTQLADGDRVSLITYATDVTLNIPTTTINASSRRRLRSAINAIWAAGGTNLSGGLSAGLSQVRANSGGDSLSRVVLLSDGRATIGETSPHRLAGLVDSFMAQGISLTTMGLGLDYNEDLMTTLALAGGGNYYYIEHSRGLAGTFRGELNGFGSTIGRDVEFTLELPPGVRVDNVYGYRYQQRGRQLQVKLNSVAAGQKRRLLLTLSPPRGQRGSMVLARPSVSYRHEKSRKRRNVNLKPVRVVATADRSLVARSFDRRVIEKLETVRNAAVRRRVLTHMDKGNYAAAQQAIDDRYRQGAAVARSVRSPALKKQLSDLKDMQRTVRGRPAAKAYQRFRKSRSKEAFDMDQL